MALILRFAFFALLLLPYQCGVKAEDCSESQCLLLPDGADLVASEFHFKASQKGVRLVYINLVIGNASYDPLELQDVFLPHRWVWANTIREPMLSLPDDYDILSLGLLNYQVRRIDVKLKDHPSGCLAKLNSTCQNQAVGRMLLENVTSSISGDVLQNKTPVACLALINRSLETVTVRYHCCDIHKEATGPATIRCDQRVDLGNWRLVAYLFFYLASISLTLYSAALPLALPDYVFNLEDEIERESRPAEQTNIEIRCNCNCNGADRSNTEDCVANLTNRETTRDERDNQRWVGLNQFRRDRGEASEFIPLDDSSPMNVSSLLRKLVHRWPAMPLSFNAKLAVLLLYVYPCASYFHLLCYRTLKEMHLKEYRNKQVSYYAVSSFLLIPLFPASIGEWQPLLLLIAVFLILGLPVLFSKPTDFVIPEGKECSLCKRYSEKIDNAFPFSDRRLIGDEIRRHLKIMFNLGGEHLVSWENICCLGMWLISLKNSNQKSRLSRAIRVVLILIVIPFGILILIAIAAIYVACFFVFLGNGGVTHSPFMTTLKFCEIKFFDSSNTRYRIMYLLGVFPIIILYWVSTISIYFFISVLGHTVLGLTLNISIVAPFVIFVLALATSLYLCYDNMQNKYKDVKKIISDFERQQELDMNRNSPEDTSSTLIKNGTISTELFWFVCERVLPHEYELLRMLRNMVLVSVYLCLALSSIVFFGDEYDISTLTLTISAFFTSSVPSLSLKALTTNTNIMGWAKFKMVREIEKAVKEYRDSRNGEALEQQNQETLV